jgi:hypothetical protein
MFVNTGILISLCSQVCFTIVCVLVWTWTGTGTTNHFPLGNLSSKPNLLLKSVKLPQFDQAQARCSWARRSNLLGVVLELAACSAQDAGATSFALGVNDLSGIGMGAARFPWGSAPFVPRYVPADFYLDAALFLWPASSHPFEACDPPLGTQHDPSGRNRDPQGVSHARIVQFQVGCAQVWRRKPRQCRPLPNCRRLAHQVRESARGQGPTLAL